jgi:hypothetical protein
MPGLRRRHVIAGPRAIGEPPLLWTLCLSTVQPLRPCSHPRRAWASQLDARLAGSRGPGRWLKKPRDARKAHSCDFGGRNRLESRLDVITPGHPRGDDCRLRALPLAICGIGNLRYGILQYWMCNGNGKSSYRASPVPPIGSLTYRFRYLVHSGFRTMYCQAQVGRDPAARPSRGWGCATKAIRRAALPSLESAGHQWMGAALAVDSRKRSPCASPGQTTAAGCHLPSGRNRRRWQNGQGGVRHSDIGNGREVEALEETADGLNPIPRREPPPTSATISVAPDRHSDSPRARRGAAGSPWSLSLARRPNRMPIPNH